jgi:hypothetical protein
MHRVLDASYQNWLPSILLDASHMFGFKQRFYVRSISGCTHTHRGLAMANGRTRLWEHKMHIRCRRYDRLEPCAMQIQSICIRGGDRLHANADAVCVYDLEVPIHVTISGQRAFKAISKAPPQEVTNNCWCELQQNTKHNIKQQHHSLPTSYFQLWKHIHLMVSIKTA